MIFLDSLFGLSGKVALITGASKGLGKSAALALAEAGALVVLVGRDEDALKEVGALTGSQEIKIADVTLPQDMMRVVKETHDKLGRIDILINNAGIIRRSPAIEMSGQDWQEVIETNLGAVFSWSQAVGKIMIDQGGGKIVNLASLLSFSGGLNVAAYAASKGGVAQLTKALSNEWAKYNINVNAIAPGYFTTEATAALRSNAVRSEQIMGRIPAGRWGEPADLAGAFIFLASAASDYVNGHVLVVDGGWMAY